MQRQAVLDLERQITGARFESGTDDGINLAVRVRVRAVQLGLKPFRIEQDVRVQAGQRAQNVVGAEMAVALHLDFGQFALDNFSRARVPLVSFCRGSVTLMVAKPRSR